MLSLPDSNTCSSVSVAGRDDSEHCMTVRIYHWIHVQSDVAELRRSLAITVAGAALIIFHVTCLNTKVLLQTVCDLSFRIALYDSVSLKVQMFPMQTNITELATQSTKQ